MKRVSNFLGGTWIVLATCSVAIAGDLPVNLPVKAPLPYVSKAAEVTGYDWNGWYIGAHAG